MVSKTTLLDFILTESHFVTLVTLKWLISKDLCECSNGEKFPPGYFSLIFIVSRIYQKVQTHAPNTYKPFTSA